MDALLAAIAGLVGPDAVLPQTSCPAGGGELIFMLVVNARSPRDDVMREAFDVTFSIMAQPGLEDKPRSEQARLLEELVSQDRQQPGATAAAAISYEAVDGERAEALQRQATDRGSAIAPFNLGGYYKSRDPRKSFEFYKLAAERGNALSMHKCAVILESGDGVRRNLKEAMSWYERAGKSGNGMSYNNLGNLIDADRPVDNGMFSAEAMVFIERGVDLGCSYSKVGLAKQFLMDDPMEAVPLLAEAIADETYSQSNGQAALLLGMVYATPEFGFPNPEWAATLMNRAEEVEPGLTAGLGRHLPRHCVKVCWSSLPPIVEARERNFVAQTQVLHDALKRYIDHSGSLPASIVGRPVGGDRSAARGAIQDMLQAKQRGNSAFAAGLYEEAASCYAQALEYVEAGEICDSDLTTEDAAEVAKVLANKAECHLRLDQPEDAEEACCNALEYDGCNWKARCRRAKALQRLGRLAEAVAELEDNDVGKEGEQLLQELQASRGDDADGCGPATSSGEREGAAPRPHPNTGKAAATTPSASTEQLKRQKEEGGLDYVLTGEGGFEAGVQLADPMGRCVFKLAEERAKRGDRRSVYLMYQQLQESARNAGISDRRLRKQLEAEFGIDPVSAKNAPAQTADEREMKSAVRTDVGDEADCREVSLRPLRVPAHPVQNVATADAKAAVHSLIAEQPELSHRALWQKLRADFPQFADTSLEQVKRYARKFKKNVDQGTSSNQVAEELSCRDLEESWPGRANEQMADWIKTEEFDRSYRAAVDAALDPSRVDAFSEARGRAKGRDPCACLHLALLYMKGDGCTKSIEKALEQVSRARELGTCGQNMPCKIRGVDVDHLMRELRQLRKSDSATGQRHTDEAWLAFRDELADALEDDIEPCTARGWEAMLARYGFELDRPLPEAKVAKPCPSLERFFEMAGVQTPCLLGLTHNKQRLPKHLRSATLKCGHCGARAEKMKRCAICRQPWCSKECQEAAWPGHEAECKAVFAATCELPGSPCSAGSMGELCAMLADGLAQGAFL